MTTGYLLSMYKNISWNTGLAAARARHNLQLKKKRGRKKNIQASNKRARKDLDSYEIPDIK